MIFLVFFFPGDVSFTMGFSGKKRDGSTLHSNLFRVQKSSHPWEK